MNAQQIIAGKVESLFYQIGMADTAKELHFIESQIDGLTDDADEKVELLRAILNRFAWLNLEVAKFDPRWN